MQDLPMNRYFTHFARKAAELTGSPIVFLLAVLSVIVWALFGPYFRFSQNWQLVINTGTTIVTFLLVFLIQNTQNRDAKAMHLKLDELIRAVGAARNRLVHLEEFTDEELGRLEIEFHRLHEKQPPLRKTDQ